MRSVTGAKPLQVQVIYCIYPIAMEHTKIKSPRDFANGSGLSQMALPIWDWPEATQCVPLKSVSAFGTIVPQGYRPVWDAATGCSAISPPVRWNSWCYARLPGLS